MAENIVIVLSIMAFVLGILYVRWHTKRHGLGGAGTETPPRVLTSGETSEYGERDH